MADRRRAKNGHDPSQTEWIEISIEADGEAAEAVSALLNEYVPSATILEELLPNDSHPHVVKVKAFLPAERETALPRIEEALWHLGQIYPLPRPSVRRLSDADWTEAWKAGYTVQHIGQRMVIKPSWQSYAAPPGKVLIELDPGLAFGTGLHPSTRLCLLALEDHLRPGARVLDVGTGSGILAIAAAKLGAGSVVAIDIDSTAVRVARENTIRNGVEKSVSLLTAALCAPASSITSHQSIPTLDSLGQINGVFDVLLMNILASIIMQSARALAAYLAPDGLFVVSGITESQECMVGKALSDAGLTVFDRRAQGDWVALLGRLSNGAPPA
ncbi:MAG: hypothetical protein AMJ93_14695 [Anaerolineae bacterium SM23_84]|nr:MAG: hypothetical protein AMJ93_14695 [Anaerolineae bacterium SM23_84]